MLWEVMMQRHRDRGLDGEESPVRPRISMHGGSGDIENRAIVAGKMLQVIGIRAKGEGFKYFGIEKAEGEMGWGWGLCYIAVTT